MQNQQQCIRIVIGRKKECDAERVELPEVVMKCSSMLFCGDR